MTFYASAPWTIAPIGYDGGMEFKVTDDAGVALDATVEIAPGVLILQSRGGAKGSPSARNRQYADGLRMILQRLLASPRRIEGIWVDSSKVQHIPLPDRQVLSPQDLPISAAKAFSLVSQRMEVIGQAPGADPGKGNRNKRLRFDLSGGSVGEIAALVGGKPGPDVPRHALRLPAEDLRRVGPDHIWRAVQALREGATAEGFGAATGLEVVVDDTLRLPPKAIFGLAATAALSFQVEPSHFSSGEDQLALQLIAEADIRSSVKARRRLARRFRRQPRTKHGSRERQSLRHTSGGSGSGAWQKPRRQRLSASMAP